MKRHTFIQTALAALVAAGLGIAGAQTLVANQDRMRGYELLSDEERDAYLERLRLAQTEQERERIRLEHRDKMALRRRALDSVQGGGAPGAGPGNGPASGMGRHQPPPIQPRKRRGARP